jgi:hypothetical protein
LIPNRDEGVWQEGLVGTVAGVFPLPEPEFFKPAILVRRGMVSTAAPLFFAEAS